jgi:hypothetical protein
MYPDALRQKVFRAERDYSINSAYSSGLESIDLAYGDKMDAQPT